MARTARTCTLTVALIAATAAFGAPPRTQTSLACESVGSAPQLHCTLTIRGPDGTPLKGAAVTLGASMPADPTAPPVRPVTAGATATPGEYRGALALEKGGVWVVMIDIGGPVKDRLARSVKVDACAAGRRCPAPLLPDPAAKK